MAAANEKNEHSLTLSDLALDVLTMACEMFFYIELMSSDAQPSKKGIE